MLHVLVVLALVNTPVRVIIFPHPFHLVVPETPLVFLTIPPYHHPKPFYLILDKVSAIPAVVREEYLSHSALHPIREHSLVNYPLLPLNPIPLRLIVSPLPFVKIPILFLKNPPPPNAPLLEVPPEIAFVFILQLPLPIGHINLISYS